MASSRLHSPQGRRLLEHLGTAGDVEITAENQQTDRPSVINKRGENGWTPIMKAARKGLPSLFDLLLTKNADLTLVDDFGDSLLHLACAGGNRYIVEQILTPSNIDSRGQNGWTPIMTAAIVARKMFLTS